MIKKFIAQLIGNWEKIGGAKRFHQQEQIEGDLAKERAKEAQERERERLLKQREGKAPSEEKILELHPEDEADRGEA